MNKYKSRLRLSICFLGLYLQQHNSDFALLFHDHNKDVLALLKLAINDCDKLYSPQESHPEYSTSGQPVATDMAKLVK
jgi:hypothetical protein